MPRIPEIQRQQLASAAVGTPGVDVSGQIEAEGIVAFGEGLSKAEDAVRKQKAKEQEAQLKAQAKQREKIQDAASTVAADKETGNLRRELREFRKTNPSEQDYDKFRTSIQDKFIGKFGEDAQAVKKFSPLMRSVLDKDQQDFFQQKDEELVGQVQEDINVSLDNTAHDVADAFSDPSQDLGLKLELFDEAVETTRATLTNARSAIGEDEFKRISEEHAKTLAETAILSLMDNNPGLVEQFLESTEVESVLSPDEIEGVRKEANQKIKERQAFAKAEKIRQTDRTESDLLLRATGGSVPGGAPGEQADPVTELEINRRLLDGEISPKFAKELKEFNKSAKKHKAVTKGEDYDSVLLKLSSILDQPESQENSLAVLQDAKLLILRAQNKGNMTTKEANDLMKFISPRFEESFDQFFQKFNGRVAWGWFNDELQQRFEDPTQIAHAKMQLNSLLMDEIAAEEERIGRSLDILEIDKIINKKILPKYSFQRVGTDRDRPDKILFRIGDQIELPDGTKAVITGFDKFGKARASTDLDAPLGKKAELED